MKNSISPGEKYSEDWRAHSSSSEELYCSCKESRTWFPALTIITPVRGGATHTHMSAHTRAQAHTHLHAHIHMRTHKLVY